MASCPTPLIPAIVDAKGRKLAPEDAPDICRFIKGAVRLTVTKDAMVRPERFSKKQAAHLRKVGRGHRAEATAGICVAFTTTGTQVSLRCGVLRPLDRDHEMVRDVIAGKVAEQRRAKSLEEGRILSGPDDENAPEPVTMTGGDPALAVPTPLEGGLIDSIVLEYGGMTQPAVVRSGRLTFHLENPEGDAVECRIWLPYIMDVAVGDLTSDGELAPLDPRPLLYTVGDSITQGFVVGSPAAAWPAILAQSLSMDLVNQGVAGHVFDPAMLKGMGRVRRAHPPVAVVAFGTNDWYQAKSPSDFRAKATEFCQRLVKELPETRIYLVSPLWRADVRAVAMGRMAFSQVAGILRSIAMDLGINFVNGLDLVPHDVAFFGDLRLHPNAKGAARMADGLSRRIMADGDPVAVDPATGLTIPTLEADEESRRRADAPGTHMGFDALVRTIWRLRQPDGCPWDREQTHHSIRRNMVEEAYEAVDAIDQGDPMMLREELGDVLMQVLLHAQIAADEGDFTIDDVVATLDEKLVRRHPHVFGELDAQDSDEVLGIWESVKDDERAHGLEPAGLLDSVPRSLPALMQCQKLSKRAAKVGFDWDDLRGVWDKVAEERLEFEAEEPGTDAAEVEFGDLLFSLVNVARKSGIDAEEALRRSCAKFRHRWSIVESLAAEQGKDPSQLSHDALEDLWAQAKGEKRR